MSSKSTDSKKPCVVAVCSDPGATRAILPILLKLQSDNLLTLTIYSYNEGVAILKESGLAYRTIPDNIDSTWVTEQLVKDNPAILLSGTSYNGLDWEKLFITTSNKLDIYTLAVLDFWGNHEVRFSDRKGNLIYVPDMIAVMDDLAQSEMVSLGIPIQNIMITGQPAFDALPNKARSFSSKHREALRESLGVKPKHKLVLFASQPIKKLYEMDDNLNSPGFNEQIVLETLISSLELISKKHNELITLLVRPHPRETLDEYNHYRSDIVTVLVSNDGDTRDFAMCSDLVVGMTSVLLVEACYLGCIVVSLQPGLLGQDILPTNSLGASTGVFKEREIGPTIERMLTSKSANLKSTRNPKSLKLASNATQQILGHIYNKSINTHPSQRGLMA